MKHSTTKTVKIETMLCTFFVMVFFFAAGYATATIVGDKPWEADD